MSETDDQPVGFVGAVARSIRWLLDRAMLPDFPLAQVLLLTTALLFLTQRITVSIFLDRFGVQPEEIGWDLQITLARTAPLMLFGASAALISWVLVWLVAAAVRKDLPTERSRFVVPFWLFLAAYAFVLPVGLAAPAGRSVANGAKAPLGLITGFPDECVELVGDPGYEDRPSILLGESGGRLVIWDLQARQTLRIRSLRVDVVRIPRNDCVEVGLERGDEPADRGLGVAQFMCGPSEVAVSVRGLERHQRGERRQVFDLRIESMSSSCGSGVPIMAVDSHRGDDELEPLHATMSEDEVHDHWSRKNVESIDGFPTHIFSA